MMDTFDDLRKLKPGDLQNESLDWLKKCFTREFKRGVTESKIIFSDSKGTSQTYIKISCILKNEASWFLKNKLIVEKIKGRKLKGPFIRLDLLYWYISEVNDFWNYDRILDTLFYLVFHKMGKYDVTGEGYWVLFEHLKNVTNKWRAIKRTLLIGFAYYLGLFQETSVLSLEAVYKGLKDRTLRDFGLTIASKQSFGKVTHYEILKKCWNCGDEIEDERSGLCGDCLDYWDRKTR